MITEQGTEAQTRYVTGRRWHGEDLVTGRYIEHWGSDGKAVLVELPDGERVSLVAQTVSEGEPVGEMLARFGVSLDEVSATHFTGRHELTEVIAKVATPVEETVVEPIWPVAEPDELLADDHIADLAAVAAPSWWRRAVDYARAEATPVRVAYVAATGGAFFGSLVTWLVTR